MKITIFQSDKGDCLLLTSKSGKTNILSDAGMRESYTTHVSPTLTKLPSLDLVYVSHIDQDHISGVLQLMDDIVAWRVYDYHKKNGNVSLKPPKSKRPPQIKGIWHNAFHEQVGKNAGEISDMLAASASVLFGTSSPIVREIAYEHQDLATSTAEAIQLSRRVGAAQLDIPLNSPEQRKLMYVREDNKTFKLGSFTIDIIGPFERDLENLRTEWNQWLKNHRDALKKLAERARRDEKRLQPDEAASILTNSRSQADELSIALNLPLTKKLLGRRKEVTTPNLASLMLLAREGKKSCLLTGDGHADDIFHGLESAGTLNSASKMHVDVIKVQHHGSEHNMNEDFARNITADHYIFCGNGAHKNPDLDVVELILENRLSTMNRPFKLWFNSSESVAKNEEHAAHMYKIENLVRRHAVKSDGRITYKFLASSRMDLVL